ncbi:ATP-binding protein [uncultured Thiodictyon sp.]|uniref:sensor histidine kinase n=1 Tax=uncultured Thiodictyon sp. TaxID=1846217 RepID=UPI0025E0C77A|nr:ATP-binding protein [uncultured Thiodictyon sp.]
MIFDARTGFLFISVLSLVISLALWTVLWRQRTLALHLWCGGGIAAAVSSLLFALRAVVPTVLGFTLATLLAFLMLVLKLQAVRLALDAPEPPSRLVILVLAFLAGYQSLLLSASEPLRYVITSVAFIIMNTRVAWWAWRLGRRGGQRSADWIAAAFALMATMFGLRLLSAGLGASHPGLLTQGYDSLLLALTVTFGIIVSNIAWLGLALERLIGAQVAAAAAQARGEENRLLSERIAQLERQRSLGLLSASLAHELNQPLTAILTNAEVAQRGLRSSDDDRIPALALLDKIVHNTERARQIVEHIRGFIRPAKDQREPVDLVQVILDVAELVAAEARAQRTDLDLRLPQHPLWITGDPIQLSQIVLNVLRNAIEAASLGERREIEVRLDQQDGQARLQVQDRGPGLSPAALREAGQPFFTTKTQGLGLGLSISRTIAGQHGGNLTLTNAAGGGALAELRLPLRALRSTEA